MMTRPKRYAKVERAWVDEETVKMIDELVERLGLERSAVIRLMLKYGYWKIKSRNYKIHIGGEEF
jgi:hypothetical protein